MSLDQELLAQIDKYKEIMQKDPNSREFLTLADLYRKLGVAEEATNILKDGLKKHPDYVQARLAIARIFLTQGQVEDATREFETVIAQDSQNFVAFKLLGEIAMQKQEHEKAAERFGSAYRIQPDDQECKVMLDYIGSLLGRDVTPEVGGAAPAPAPPTVPPSGQTIAVAPEGEFGEFEPAEEELELPGGLVEEPEAFEEIEEFEEIDEFAEPEGFEEIEEIEEVAEDVFEEEILEEEFEEVEELEEFEEEVFAGEEEALDTEDLSVFEEVEEPDIEPVKQVPEEVPGEEDEELVTQIFQDLSDSKYTSEEGGLLDNGESELEDLMGLLDSEEPEDLGTDFGVTESEVQEPESVEEEEKDLESLIDLEGVPGIEELPEEIEEAEMEGFPEESAFSEVEEFEEIEEEIEETSAFEEGIEDVEEVEEIETFEEIEELPGMEEMEEIEAFEEVEGLPGMEEIEEIEEFEEAGGLEELEEIEEFEDTEFPEPEGEVTEVIEAEESDEQSSIFQDFGLAEGEEAEPSAEEGDVFQDFDFDVFEQELLKDHPPQEVFEAMEEAEMPELAESEETIEEIAEEELEEFGEEEAFIEEEFEEGEEEGTGEDELPAASLAELYIKQDLFEEATTIYQKILQAEPSDVAIRQMLEETIALQAYVEGME